MRNYAPTTKPGAKRWRAETIETRNPFGGQRSTSIIEQVLIRDENGEEVPLGGTQRGPTVIITDEERDTPSRILDPITDEPMDQARLDAIADMIRSGYCTTGIGEVMVHSTVRRWQGERDTKEAAAKDASIVDGL